MGRVDTPWCIVNTDKREMSRELRPGICVAVIGVTLEPAGFDVLPVI